VPQTVVFAHAISGTDIAIFAGNSQHRQLTRFWHTGQTFTNQEASVTI